MKILITNTAVLNTGDAAIVEGMRVILKRALGSGATFSYFGADPAAAARHYPHLEVRPSLFDLVSRWTGTARRRKAALALVLLAAWLTRVGLSPRLWPMPAAIRRACAEYASADAVVSAGGTYLVPHYRLAPRIFDFLVVLALRRPLVLFTQSLGPFAGGRDSALLRYVLRRAHLILVRDERSRRHLAELSIPRHRIAIVPDAAFALAPPQARPRPPRTLLRIAVSVRDWPFLDDDASRVGMTRYLEAIAGFAETMLTEHGAEITFVSSCQGARDYWTDDSGTAMEAVARLPEPLRDQVTVDREFRCPQDLIRRLRTFDLVVSTRMHVAILALCAGVPVIPIAYEFKTTELSRTLGLDGLTRDISTVSAESLVSAWRDLHDSLDSFEATLWPRVAAAREAALSSGELVGAVLSPRGAA